VFEDFDMDDEEKLISHTLIIAAYDKEISDNQDFKSDFKQEESMTFGVYPSS
jgi:hypothetical protein